VADTGWTWDVKLRVSCGEILRRILVSPCSGTSNPKIPWRWRNYRPPKRHVQEGLTLQTHRSGNLQSWNLEYVNCYFSASIPATQLPNAKLKLGIKARGFYWLSRFRLVTSQALCAINICAQKFQRVRAVVIRSSLSPLWTIHCRVVKVKVSFLLW